MRNCKEYREKGTELFKELVEEAENCPVLVEGKRDAKALKEMGLAGELINLQEKNLSKACEEIAAKHRKAIILTDPDSEGGRIAHQVAKILEQYGVHPLMKYRKVTRLLGKGAVEELRPLCLEA